MKTFLLFFIALFFIGCTGHELTFEKAKKTALHAMFLINKQKYDSLSTMYSEDFRMSEPPEIRNNKLKNIFAVSDTIISYQLMDSIETIEIGEESRIILIYKVKHHRLTILETYKITKENGEYVIAGLTFEISK
jgi:hypothetical protein